MRLDGTCVSDAAASMLTASYRESLSSWMQATRLALYISRGQGGVSLVELMLSIAMITWVSFEECA